MTSAFSRFVAVAWSDQRGEAYREEERKFWPWNDPALVSEAFFSLGTMMSFPRLMRVFQVGIVIGSVHARHYRHDRAGNVIGIGNFYTY